MPETGNNTTCGTKKLSIRLSSDGLSFLVQGDRAPLCGFIAGASGPETVGKLAGKNAPGRTDGPVNVLLETLKTVAVPTSIFEEETATSYLAVNSLMPAHDETAVVSPEAGDVRCVMVWNTDTLRALHDHWGNSVHFYSPLQQGIATVGEQEVLVGLGRRLLCLVFRDNRIRYAEMLPFQGVADLLYYMGHLNTLFDLSKAKIRLTGPGAVQLTKELRHHYINMTADESPRFMYL